MSKFSLEGKVALVTGGSYGGFMTNWIIGHTDRFAAAVSQRSISNWINFTANSFIMPMPPIRMICSKTFMNWWKTSIPITSCCR